jgi:hypothetical protein
VFGNQWVKEKFPCTQDSKPVWSGVEWFLSFSKEEVVSKGWVISTLDWQLSQNRRTTFDLKPSFSKSQRTHQITNHSQAFHLCQFFQQTPPIP